MSVWIPDGIEDMSNLNPTTSEQSPPCDPTNPTTSQQSQAIPVAAVNHVKQFCVRVLPSRKALTSLDRPKGSSGAKRIHSTKPLPYKVLQRLLLFLRVVFNLNRAAMQDNNRCTVYSKSHDVSTHNVLLGWRLLLLTLLLLFGCRPVRGDHSRVMVLVEQYPEASTWEFHSRPSRQAIVSKKSWDEYNLYKEQTCRPETKDAAADYFNWEEMTFHKNLRLKLLPTGFSSDHQMGIGDAMMLSKIDGRFLSPEAESLCHMGPREDSQQSDFAEKDNFEDKLIGRIFNYPGTDEEDDKDPAAYADDVLV